MAHNEQEVLRAAFDVETHKKTFINYLEVVILEDGTIEYAVPSHRLKVTSIIAKKRNITYEEVADLCPIEYYMDYYYWLCKESKSLMVWNNFYMGNPNEAQIKALVMLINEKLFRGSIEWEK